MRLSTRARYALRVMLDIARHGGSETPVPLGAVAHRTDLSHGYLEQLAVGLRKGRLIQGVAGRNGGYRLAATVSDIRVSDVIEASIGPVCIVDCVSDPSICRRASHCECRALYCLVNRRIAEELESLTLADLLDPAFVAKHGGFSPEEVRHIPEGPDPCTMPRGRRRGRPRTRPHDLAATRGR
jgi:Rrf2 family cysteine metabolism transcriptional repressor